jgi:Family of unknown function (DUF6232)
MATLTITSHVIKFANRIIQISNISEASIWVNKTTQNKALKWIFVGVMIVAACLFAVSRADENTKPLLGWALMLGIVIVVVSGFFLKPLYGLLLHTNSGREVAMASKDYSLMQNVLSEIQDAMTHRDPNKNVTINVGNAISNATLFNSQVGNEIGGGVNNNFSP